VRLAAIPKGLCLTAQGCCTRLPWDLARNGAQPQRGCVVQPKVAVLSYLGTSPAKWSATPTGLCLTAQGCCTRLPWDLARNGAQPQRGCVVQPKVAVLSYLGISPAKWSANPTGLWLSLVNAKASGEHGMPQPFQGWDPSPTFPKVADYSNLGLVAATPSGLPDSANLEPLRREICATNPNTVASQSHT
jgi:hypothetical protein